MKAITFHCDRCDTTAVGRNERSFTHPPGGWTVMAFDYKDFDLCPNCAEDVRLALANMKLELRK